MISSGRSFYSMSYSPLTGRLQMDWQQPLLEVPGCSISKAATIIRTVKQQLVHIWAHCTLLVLKLCILITTGPHRCQGGEAETMPGCQQTYLEEVSLFSTLLLGRDRKKRKNTQATSVRTLCKVSNSAPLLEPTGSDKTP